MVREIIVSKINYIRFTYRVVCIVLAIFIFLDSIVIFDLTVLGYALHGRQGIR